MTAARAHAGLKAATRAGKWHCDVCIAVQASARVQPLARARTADHAQERARVSEQAPGRGVLDGSAALQLLGDSAF